MLKKNLSVLLFLIIPFTVMSGGSSSSANRVSDDAIVGRWDMTIQDTNGITYPSWFEASREGNKLTGRFVGRVGSQRPIKTIEYAEGKLKFSLPIQYERRKTDLEFEGKLAGDRIEGTAPDAEGKPMRWTAVRAPKLERKSPRWSKPASLFNGRDLRGRRDGKHAARHRHNYGSEVYGFQTTRRVQDGREEQQRRVSSGTLRGPDRRQLRTGTGEPSHRRCLWVHHALEQSCKESW